MYVCFKYIYNFRREEREMKEERKERRGKEREEERERGRGKEGRRHRQKREGRQGEKALSLSLISIICLSLLWIGGDLGSISNPV